MINFKWELLRADANGTILESSIVDNENDAADAAEIMITVNVTDDDIIHGETGLCKTCPVARAINRLLVDGVESAVAGPYFRIWRTDDCMPLYRIELPDSVHRWIRSFDRRELSQPFSFEIDIPVQFIKLVTA